MDSTWLVGVILGVVVASAFVVFLYTPGRGRQVRHWVVGRFWWKVEQSGRVLVGLRVVDGVQEGLSGRVSGSALMSPGRVEFTRWVGGLPLVRRPIPVIEVTAAGMASQPRGLAKVRFGDPDVQVARLRTPTATLEIAIFPPASVEQVLAQLRTPGMAEI